MPGNCGDPSHTALRELAVTGPWRDRLSGVRWPDVEEPATYLARLAQLGLQVNAWETTYQQVLPGEDAVLEWMRGTRAVLFTCAVLFTRAVLGFRARIGLRSEDSACGAEAR